MTLREFTLPVAHPQNPISAGQSQDDSPRTAPRRCLLKGCNRYFPPNHSLDRYCSDRCTQAARRWTIAMANLNYRSSDNGKQKRREQAARYRSRCKERQQQCQNETAHQELQLADQEPADQSGSAPSESPREGYHKRDSREKSCCHRPGCYERFTPGPRSPQQKFCCSSCHKALRAVLIRERRWFSRLLSRLYRNRAGPR